MHTVVYITLKEVRRRNILWQQLTHLKKKLFCLFAGTLPSDPEAEIGASDSNNGVLGFDDDDGR